MRPILWLPMTLILASAAFAQERGAPGLRTRFAADVDRAAPHSEYPRPKLVRKSWQSLNGAWDLAIVPDGAPRPTQFDREILVPFGIESALSGVAERVGPDRRAWYRRRFEVPVAWQGSRVLLHFGAVDWHAEVFVDDLPVGEHRGGYDSFSFDITTALEAAGPHEVIVAVWDPSDAGGQPRGKQVQRPRGIWYTPVTGIWQTVWIEPVPRQAIRRVLTVPDLRNERATVHIEGDRLYGLKMRAVVTAAEAEVVRQTGPATQPLTLALPGARRWSPEDPYLHSLHIELLDGDRVVDDVRSDFGMRSIEVAPDEQGVPRLVLNGEPRFMLGLLDQGYWPDGLYTAPTDAALRYDLEVTKSLGFDTVRKHVKVEPQRWYDWCDRLGLLVWQDVPSSTPYIRADEPDAIRDAQSARRYRREAAAIIAACELHPSVVMWVPFNEGWGQFDTAGIAAWFADRDPSRLVNATSGWADRGVGDVRDLHAYPGPGMPPLEERRAAVLGEFGGLGLPIRGHTWQDEANWGYRSFTSRDALNDAYAQLLVRLRPLVARGLSAAIYTQTTDVEIEVNGVLTYDRAIVKLDGARMRPLHDDIRGRPPRLRVVVPTSRDAPQPWRYTFEPPAPGWPRADFDDGAWREGPGGFGTAATPGAVVGTTWDGPSIWLRRSIDLPPDATAESLWLDIGHDEDVEVFVDGVRILARTGWTDGYVLEPIDDAAPLTPGRHVVAVHCEQTNGGQFVDVGFVEVVERR